MAVDSGCETNVTVSGIACGKNASRGSRRTRGWLSTPGARRTSPLQGSPGKSASRGSRRTRGLLSLRCDARSRAALRAAGRSEGYVETNALDAGGARFYVPFTPVSMPAEGRRARTRVCGPASTLAARRKGPLQGSPAEKTAADFAETRTAVAALWRLFARRAT